MFTSLDSVYKPNGINKVVEKESVEVLVFPNPARSELNILIKCACDEAFNQFTTHSEHL